MQASICFLSDVGSSLVAIVKTVGVWNNVGGLFYRAVNLRYSSRLIIERVSR